MILRKLRLHQHWAGVARFCGIITVLAGCGIVVVTGFFRIALARFCGIITVAGCGNVVVTGFFGIALARFCGIITVAGSGIVVVTGFFGIALARFCGIVAPDCSEKRLPDVGEGVIAVPEVRGALPWVATEVIEPRQTGDVLVVLQNRRAILCDKSLTLSSGGVGVLDTCLVSSGIFRDVRACDTKTVICVGLVVDGGPLVCSIGAELLDTTLRVTWSVHMPGEYLDEVLALRVLGHLLEEWVHTGIQVCRICRILRECRGREFRISQTTELLDLAAIICRHRCRSRSREITRVIVAQLALARIVWLVVHQ